jgi:hypothetical protein
MPITPLDLQVNMAQMTNVAQQQQAAQRYPLIQQEQMGIVAQEQAKIDQEKIQALEKAEGKKIEADKKGSGGGYYYGARKRQKEPKDEKERDERQESLDPRLGQTIDVTK